MAAHAFEEFLNEGRKLNMAVWLVMQDLAKVLKSALSKTILQQCFTKVCLPNPQALSDGASDYEALELKCSRSRNDCARRAQVPLLREFA